MTNDGIPVLTDVVRRGRRNRQRGQEGEREVCALLTAAYGIPVKRLLGQERDSGHDINLDPFRIECKRRKKIANLYQWLDQADAAAGPVYGCIPIVTMRADAAPWLVVMYLDDWITLAREEISATNERD